MERKGQAGAEANRMGREVITEEGAVEGIFCRKSNDPDEHPPIGNHQIWAPPTEQSKNVAHVVLLFDNPP